MKKTRMLISCLLVLCMAVTMIPSALAADDEAALMQASEAADDAPLMQASEAAEDAALMQASETVDDAPLMQASAEEKEAEIKEELKEAAPAEAAAPAEDPANSSNEIIIVTDDDAKTVQLGGNEVQLFVDAQPNNINFMDSAGTENNVPTKTHAEVTIPEDIHLTWLDADNVFDGSPKLTVTADGEIHASDSNNNLSQAYAVSCERAGDNSIDITVKKDVTCEATSYEPISIAVQATNDSDSDKSLVNIVLEGNLTVKATSVADSTQTEAPVDPVNGGALYRETLARAVVADGDVQVTVKGDVSVTAQGGTVSNDAIGIIAKRGGNVTMEKNLTTSGGGINVDAYYDPSTIIVKGEIRVPDTAVAISLDKDTSAKDLPTVIIGAIKDEKGNAVADPESKISVGGNSDPDLVKQAMAQIYYIIDKSGVGESVSVTGTRTVTGFDGEVACAGDQITISTGSSSVLEGVSAGEYATVTQINEYTYVITVKHGGNLILTGRWTPAVSFGASPNPGMIKLKAGSEDSGTAGEKHVYEVNMKKTSQATLQVANLKKHMAEKGLKYIVIRTLFGSFRVPVEELVKELEETDALTFRINGKTLEIYLGKEMIASFDIVNA